MAVTLTLLHPQRFCGFLILLARLFSDCISPVLMSDPVCASWDTVVCCLARRAKGGEGVVMRQQGTCYVNLGGKAWTYLEKMPFYTLFGPVFFLFYRFLQLTVGISSLTWILILSKLKVHFTQIIQIIYIIQIFFQFLLVLFSYLNSFCFLFMVGNFSYCNFRHTRKFLICYQ